MNDKDDALRLADLLQDECGVDGYVHDEAAALEAELDTLRAEIAALKSELADNESVIRVWRGRTNRAEDSRDLLRELLKECRRIMKAQDLFAHHDLYDRINTAIDAAKEEAKYG